MLGDVDNDNQITMMDFTLINYHILGRRKLSPEEFVRADIDKDGKITMMDFTLINYHILGRRKIKQS